MWIILLVLLSACAGDSGRVVRITLMPTQVGAGAPVYTPSPSFTPSNTPTVTPTPSQTFTPTATDTPTATPTATHTLTPTATHTPTATLTPTASPTPPLMSPTPLSAADGPDAPVAAAELSAAEGWSCGDFPCEDDIDGFLQRIQVPPGFILSHYGRLPGQPLQIAIGPDGRLYATVLEAGSQYGAVVALAVDGLSERIIGDLYSPLGLAFQPGTDVLYVSGRVTDEETGADRGALWRLLSDGRLETVLDDLPCCFEEIANQVNGLTFGPDGYLYLGVGAVTDRGESLNPDTEPLDERAASILRVHPHTGETEVFASGLRKPYDLTFTSDGRAFATDNGLLTGPGDRLLAIEPGAHHGWPFWRGRGCPDCPPAQARVDTVPDLLTFPPYTLPRGLTAYHGDQFPARMMDTLLVTLWNSGDGGQRVIWLDPRDPALQVTPDPEQGILPYAPQPFVTGLIRPSDVIVAPDGSILVADYIYGHVWQVRYVGADADAELSQSATPSQVAPASAQPVTAAPLVPTVTAPPEQPPANPVFVTATP